MKLEVGQKIIAGTGNDREAGVVQAVGDGTVTIGWNSGVSTTQSIEAIDNLAIGSDEDSENEYIPGHAIDAAYSAGFEAGKLVPVAKGCNGSSDQAWSDFRAQNERGEVEDGDNPDVAGEYVRGHIEGQETWAH